MMDITEIRERKTYIQRLNEHVDGCQVCQRGTLCDIAERILDEADAALERRRLEAQARKQRQAGL